MDWQKLGGNWSSITSRMRNRWARITRDDIATADDMPPQVTADDSDTPKSDGHMPDASAEDVESGNSPPLTGS